VQSYSAELQTGDRRPDAAPHVVEMRQHVSNQLPLLITPIAGIISPRLESSI
jgi:hypothetical protein